ncbi:MAG: type 1 glutamine amidotransferase [Tannerellaceae bacterium]|nr:type 1 glutamine amidotransferase [Tannerellaceae bacterium]
MQTINLLICDTFPGLLPASVESYGSMLCNLFSSATQQEIRFKTYYTHQGELPHDILPNELYLIPGSNSGAYEKKKWIKELICFIREANRKKVPMAGICFGHQVIAQALGGEVQPSEKGWGTGIRTSRIIRSNGLEYFPEGALSLHYNHHDQVIKLPPEAICFATSDFCPHEGFQIGDHILTFQGHPEYTNEYNLHLICNHGDNEPEEVKKVAIESIRTKEHQGLQVARWILSLLE